MGRKKHDCKTLVLLTEHWLYLIQESICPGTEQSGAEGAFPAALGHRRLPLLRLCSSVWADSLSRLSRSSVPYGVSGRGAAEQTAFCLLRRPRKEETPLLHLCLKTWQGIRKAGSLFDTNTLLVLSQKSEAVMVHIKSRLRCNSQGLVVLQLWVDEIHFPLSLLNHLQFLCLRQRCGFHPIRLLHLEKNYEQLRSRTPCWETGRVHGELERQMHAIVAPLHLFYFAQDLQPLLSGVFLLLS